MFYKTNILLSINQYFIRCGIMKFYEVFMNFFEEV